MVGVEHVGGVEPQLTFSKSESELLRMMRAVKEVTDHFHFFDRLSSKRSDFHFFSCPSSSMPSFVTDLLTY